jgi:hypothetical protein
MHHAASSAPACSHTWLLQGPAGQRARAAVRPGAFCGAAGRCKGLAVRLSAFIFLWSPVGVVLHTSCTNAQRLCAVGSTVARQPATHLNLRLAPPWQWGVHGALYAWAAPQSLPAPCSAAAAAQDVVEECCTLLEDLMGVGPSGSSAGGCGPA